MINFIVCDDDKEITEIEKAIITKVMMKNNMEYKIHVFNSYDNSFNRITKLELENKIYILDIEVGKKSGLEVASRIRDEDWYSVLIILTSHYELEVLAYKSRILILDFISKFDLYQEKIEDTIRLCVKNKLENKKLRVRYKGKIEQIDYNRILYITYDSSIRKIKVYTKTQEYETYQTLKEMQKHLKGNFEYAHRACIVNINNIKTIDVKNRIITFVDGSKTDLVSRNYLCKIMNNIKE